MILEFLKSDYEAIIQKLIVIGIMWSAVLVAMGIDFYFGIRKARQSGEARTSEGYRRSVEKFNHYFGMLMYALIFDAIIPISFFFDFPFTVIPIVTLLATIVLVFTEAKSVQEKAEDKQRRKVHSSFIQIVEMLEKREDILHELADRFKRENNTTNENNTTINSGD